MKPCCSFCGSDPLSEVIPVGRVCILSGFAVFIHTLLSCVSLPCQIIYLKITVKQVRMDKTIICVCFLPFCAVTLFELTVVNDWYIIMVSEPLQAAQTLVSSGTTAFFPWGLEWAQWCHLLTDIFCS